MYFFFLLVYRIKTNNNKKSYHGARSIVFFHLQKMCNNTTTIKTTIHLWKEITSVTESTVLPSNTAGRSSALGHQPLSFYPSPGGVLPATAPPTPRCLLQRNSASPDTATRSGIWARAVGASTALASPRRGPRHPALRQDGALPLRPAGLRAGLPARPRRRPTAPRRGCPATPRPRRSPRPCRRPLAHRLPLQLHFFPELLHFHFQFVLLAQIFDVDRRHGVRCQSAERGRGRGREDKGLPLGCEAVGPGAPGRAVGRWDGGAAAPGPPPASLTRCRRAAPRRPLPPHRAGHPAPRRPAFKLRANPL